MSSEWQRYRVIRAKDIALETLLLTLASDEFDSLYVFALVDELQRVAEIVRRPPQDRVLHSSEPFRLLADGADAVGR